MTISVRTAAPARARLAALGAHVPDRVITNHEIEAWVDTCDEWIRPARASGIAASEIDMVIVPTATRDHLFPSTAPSGFSRRSAWVSRTSTWSSPTRPTAGSWTTPPSGSGPATCCCWSPFRGGPTWASTIVRYEPAEAE